jgi:hypothetical protein
MRTKILTTQKFTKITIRDEALLLDVYKYRYLSFTQLVTLHFPSSVAAYRWIRILTDGGYLKAFHVPSIPERIFYLDKKGADIVATVLCVAVEGLSWYRYLKTPKDYHFLKHFLAVNDFRILLTKETQQSPITLLGFIPEYFGEKTVEGNVRKYIRDRVCDIANDQLSYSHTPDAVFSLEKEEAAALFFLEIDRGIEVVSDPEKGILKSIIFYLNYRVDGKYRRYETDFGREFKAFRVLIITTSEERLRHIRQAVTALSFAKPTVKRFVWGAVAVNRENLFSPVWQSMDVTDQNRYSIG